MSPTKTRAAPEAEPFSMIFLRLETRLKDDADFAALSKPAKGILLDVWLLMAAHGGPLTGDRAKLARLIRCSPDELEAVESELRPFLRRDEQQRLVSDVIEADRTRARDWSDKSRTGGKRSGESRRKGTTVEPSSNGGSTTKGTTVEPNQTDPNQTDPTQRDPNLDTASSRSAEVSGTRSRSSSRDRSAAAREERSRDQSVPSRKGKAGAGHLDLSDLDDPHADEFWELWPQHDVTDKHERIFAGAWREHVIDGPIEVADAEVGHYFVAVGKRYLAMFNESQRSRMMHAATWLGKMVRALEQTGGKVDEALQIVYGQDEASTVVNGQPVTAQKTKPRAPLDEDYASTEEADPWGPSDDLADDKRTKDEVH